MLTESFTAFVSPKKAEVSAKAIEWGRQALPHEHQFNLDSEAGWLALERSLRFLADCI